MKEWNILLVEDDAELLEYNRAYLERAGYQVSAAESAAAARAVLDREPPDLLVLDILLPDGSGLELCREFRTCHSAPILFLTCLGESEQVVQGLRCGGDDYITKPYRVEELLARIEAQLRRVVMTAQDGTLCFDALTLDGRTRRAYLAGEDLMLKPKEFLLLAALARQRERPMTARELYAQVWGMTSNEDVRTVLVHISNLRAKLRGDREEPAVIIRHFGENGYRLARNRGE